jgi:hydroxypyruvate isomerase
VHTHGQRFDVNCAILFTELPLLKRPAAAGSAGFDTVEFWWPFAEPMPPDHEVDRFGLDRLRIQAFRSGAQHRELRLEVTAHAAGPGEV